MNKKIVYVAVVVVVALVLSLLAAQTIQENQQKQEALEYGQKVTITGGWVDICYQKAWIENNYTRNVYNVTIQYRFVFNNGATTIYFQATFMDLGVNETETLSIDSGIRGSIVQLENHNIWLGQHPHEDRGSGGIVLFSAYGYSPTAHALKSECDRVTP